MRNKIKRTHRSSFKPVGTATLAREDLRSNKIKVKGRPTIKKILTKELGKEKAQELIESFIDDLLDKYKGIMPSGSSSTYSSRSDFGGHNYNCTACGHCGYNHLG